MDARPYRRLGPIATLAAILALAGCGGSGGVKANPQTLLRQAKATVDASPSVHFSLTSHGVSGSGTNITGGDGDVIRPDQLLGSFTVTVDGLGASVKVASKGGVFEAQLPFTRRYTRTNPASFGFSDPAQLLDPAKGLSSLLLAGTGARMIGQERLSGELLDEVAMTVPGTAVPVLPNANPSKPVAVTAAIDPSDHQLRQITLVGPFTSSTNSTFIVTLTNYGEQTTITLPPA